MMSCMVSCFIRFLPFVFSMLLVSCLFLVRLGSECVFYPACCDPYFIDEKAVIATCLGDDFQYSTTSTTCICYIPMDICFSILVSLCNCVPSASVLCTICVPSASYVFRVVLGDGRVHAPPSNSAPGPRSDTR